MHSSASLCTTSLYVQVQLHRHLLFNTYSFLSIKPKWFLFLSITQQILFLKHIIKTYYTQISYILCVCLCMIHLAIVKKCIWPVIREKVYFDSYNQLRFHSAIAYITPVLMMTIKASNYKQITVLQRREKKCYTIEIPSGNRHLYSNNLFIHKGEKH